MTQEDFPSGAIHNGRTFIEWLERDYADLLENSHWDGLKRCFEHLSNYAASPAPAVPEAWQIVPKEPTEEMIHAAIMTHVRENKGIEHSPYLSYKAMLAAAPSITIDHSDGKDKTMAVLRNGNHIIDVQEVRPLREILSSCQQAWVFVAGRWQLYKGMDAAYMDGFLADKLDCPAIPILKPARAP